jgi:signal transduction histidine kinase
MAIVDELREHLRRVESGAPTPTGVNGVIDLTADLPVEGLSRVRADELRRVGWQVADEIKERWRWSAPVDVPAYARELRLVRVEPQRIVISPLGRVLLGLPEADVVRWLLLIETLQSLGTHDDWRMPREALATVLARPNIWFSSHKEDEWPWNSSAIRRLVHLHVVEQVFTEDEAGFGYALVPAWRDTLDEIVAERTTPWRVLAQTMLAEERNAVPLARTAAGDGDEGARVLQRHAKMVAHEIHNAMTPVQHALRKLYEVLARHAPDDAWRAYQDRVDRNIDRTVRFAAQMADAASLAVAPPELFDLATVVRDAIAELNGALAGRVSFAPHGDSVRLRGHRHRFVMVVVNLLRNAVQSAPERSVRVRIDLSAQEREAIIAVNDDGPGVPEGYREAIFQPGFTLRADGRGQGLSLVRDVVEREFGGTVRYEPGDMGGARFVIRLPLSAGSAP